MAAPLSEAERAARERAVLAKLRMVPGLTADEIGRTVLPGDCRRGPCALRVLRRLEAAGLVRFDTQPATGSARFKRMWYPA
jgi:hypothetical protein